MFIKRWMKSLMPNGFLFKLTFLNILVIITVIGLSSWAIYNTACSLVDGMGHLSEQRQNQFNATLFQYLLIFCSVAIILGGVFHFYFTKKLIQPVKRLIDSTKRMQEGNYPAPILEKTSGEIGELTEQFNRLVTQLQTNEFHRVRLVSDLSHEFRTPLTNLNGYLHALESGVLKGEQEIYHNLYLESQRLIEMIEQLDQLKEWDFISEQTMMNKQKVNIAELVNHCTSIFEWALTKAKIPIVSEVERAQVDLQMGGIEQVIHNLLDNAIQYYEGNSPIIIEGKVKEKDYYVSITSPGKPIPREEKGNIFERFYRLDASRARETGGSGLGLAIAKEIIKQHQGEIGVEVSDDLNKFWFTLPN